MSRCSTAPSVAPMECLLRNCATPSGGTKLQAFCFLARTPLGPWAAGFLASTEPTDERVAGDAVESHNQSVIDRRPGLSLWRAASRLDLRSRMCALSIA